MPPLIYANKGAASKMNKLEVLKKHFGHDHFREGQSEIIDALVDGKPLPKEDLSFIFTPYCCAITLL